MKQNLSIVLLLGACLLSICSYSQPRLKQGRVLQISFASGSTNSNDRRAHCGCGGQGGILATDITFYMGTCKSECERGIGFRCGTAGIILCKDGDVQLCSMGKCFPPINQRSDRHMKASYTFYDNNTMKLTFLNPIPDEEKNNNIFEVEQDDFFSLPDEMRINNIAYKGYNVFQGDYYVNRTDGQYGSVILKISLQL